MQILLLKPPHRGFLHEIGRSYPVGLLQLASSLRSDGHSVYVFDSLAFTEDNHVIPLQDLIDSERTKVERHPRWQTLIHWGASWGRIGAILTRAKWDLIGISNTFTPFATSAIHCARLSKAANPNVPIVLGGSDATLRWAELLRSQAFDAVVLGEGEYSIVQIARLLSRGESILDAAVGIDNVATRFDSTLKQEEKLNCGEMPLPRIKPICDLDNLPLAATPDLGSSRYDGVAAIVTSRGCPRRCTFCTIHATMGRYYRVRSVESVVDEIEHLVQNWGARAVAIEDDNFGYCTERAKAIFHSIIRRDIDTELRFPNGLSVEGLDIELVDLMAKAGVSELFLGLESTDTYQLRRMAKTFTSLEKVQHWITAFQDKGVQSSASIIVGAPGSDIVATAKDVGKLLRKQIPYWSNPYYQIPGSIDHARDNRNAPLSPDDFIVDTDQYGFAFSPSMSSRHELYWSWLYAQSCSEWGDFLLDRMSHCSLDDFVNSAAKALVSYCKSHVPNTRAAGVPAWPHEVDILHGRSVISLSPEFCFCGAQHVMRGISESVILEGGVCLPSGDMLAAAISIISGIPLQSREIICCLTSSSNVCKFQFEYRDEGLDTHRAFLDEFRSRCW